MVMQQKKRQKKARKPAEKDNKKLFYEYSFRQEISSLLMKIMIIILVVLLLFTFMFGAFRSADKSMAPAVMDGDLVIHYRLDKRYMVRDCLVVEYQGKKQVRRVVARAGDVVDITEKGLYINGALQQERGIYEDTLCYKDGQEFPLTVGEGQVFLLGDARSKAIDSRIYGPVNIDDTYGKVFCIFRRRNI